MNEYQTLHEIARAARERLDDGVWDYLMGGAETEATLKRNRHSLDAIAFRPRVLRDVRNIDPRCTLFGRDSRLPVFIAPIGSLQALDASGAMGVARAAERFGIASFLSSVTQPGLEEIAAGTAHAKIFQLYVRGDESWVAEYVERALKAGYVAFCVTVDTAIYSRRERDIVKRWVPNSMRSGLATGFEYQAGLSWRQIAWFKAKYPKLPLVLKGIATAEDARIAVDHGVDGIYVSNHGGRQLDHGAGAIEILPEVVEAVGGRAQVFVDGGFYRGADVLKAIALGANAVGIGRLYGLGLAAGGEAGVLRVLELLEDEMRRAMGNLGVTSLEELDRTYIRAAVPAYAASAFESAFPFLELRASKYE